MTIAICAQLATLALIASTSIGPLLISLWLPAGSFDPFK